MGAIDRNVEVAMERPTLRDLPSVPTPRGFSIRGYRPGDEAAWTEIQTAADRFNHITPELFGNVFGSDVHVLHQRVLFADDAEGRPVGTAAAWWKTGPLDRVGRVHWVAVVPEYQERGIGRALVANAVCRLCDLGHDAAFLTTSAARLSAIRLYLAFGFSPAVRSSEEAEAWGEIASAIRVDARS
jgi:GNAT superfamily N-acetyltransferase